MKRIGIIGICLITAIGMLSLAGCGSSEMPYSQYDLDEYIKVCDYKGLNVDDYSITISQKEVEEEIDASLEAATENKELKKGTKIKNGDTVNIDYVGRIDGEEFDGGSADGQDLVIGSGQFIDGFESGLIGKTVGEKNIKVPVTFPKDYQAENLQGKDAVFTVTINSATRPEKPAYDDAFAKSQGDYKNTKQFEKALKKKIYKEKEAAAIEDQKMALWDQVITDSKAKKYPQEEVDHYMESNSEQIDAMAEQYGVSREQILTQYGYGDEETFKKSNEESSKLRVKQEMIVMKIAEDEGLSFTDEEKQEAIQMLEAQGYTDKTVQEQAGRSMDEYVSIQLLYEKALDLILENAHIN
ncbi:MAG: trigger factor [Firmicutes bacterium]|nr:trigger factor [Bacillota bacterium]